MKTKQQKIHYMRLTFTLPTHVANHVMEIPTQLRSREVTTILEEEFKRRDFLATIEKLEKEEPIISSKYVWPTIKERKMIKNIFQRW